MPPENGGHGRGRLRSRVRQSDGEHGFQCDCDSSSNPALWSVEAPNLYTAIVTVETKATRSRDAERITFGVRTVRFDADHGFFLNGQPLKIQGTCNHQDHAGVGAAVPDRLQAFRLGVLQRDGLQRRPHLAQHAHAGAG